MYFMRHLKGANTIAYQCLNSIITIKQYGKK
jgi:hypothetical protein